MFNIFEGVGSTNQMVTNTFLNSSLSERAGQILIQVNVVVPSHPVSNNLTSKIF